MVKYRQPRHCLCDRKSQHLNLAVTKLNSCGMAEPRRTTSRICCASDTRTAVRGVSAVTADAGSVTRASRMPSGLKLSGRRCCGTVASTSETPTPYGRYWQQAHLAVLYLVVLEQQTCCMSVALREKQVSGPPTANLSTTETFSM